MSDLNMIYFSLKQVAKKVKARAVTVEAVFYSLFGSKKMFRLYLFASRSSSEKSYGLLVKKKPHQKENITNTTNPTHCFPRCIDILTECFPERVIS